MTASRELYRVRRYWSSPVVLFSTFFVIVGVTLGGGIMILPVDEAMTGFWSFLLILILPFLVEVISVVLFIQILQKVRKYLAKENVSSMKKKRRNYKLNQPRIEDATPLLQKSGNEDDIMRSSVVSDFESHFDESHDPEALETNETEKEDGLKKVILSNSIHFGQTPEKWKEKEKLLSIVNPFIMAGVDLHTVSKSYFFWWYSIFTDLILVLVTFPLLYIIGSSNKLTSLFTSIGTSSSSGNGMMIDPRIISPILGTFGFMIVFLFSYFIEGILSLLTFTKTFFFIAILILVLAISQPFTSISNPFFFSRLYFTETWIISGSILFIPTLFSRLRPTKSNVILFTVSVIFGLFFSQGLCVLWSICVWGIVPQEETLGEDVNLKKSLRNGEIVNIPILRQLEKNYPSMFWVGFVIEFFILFSLLVSVILYSSVFKSVVDGGIKDVAYWVSENAVELDDQEEEEEGKEEKEEGKEIRRRRRRRKVNKKRAAVKASIFAGQVLVYLFIIIFVSFSSWVWYSSEEVFAQIMIFGLVLFEMFFVVPLICIEICRSPFRNINIWFKIPRWLFLLLGVFVGIYFVLFTSYYCFYQTLSWIFVLLEKPMPF